VHLIYAFAEPLPLPRARGVQVLNTVAALAEAGAQVDLLHVPVHVPASQHSQTGTRSAALNPFIAAGMPHPSNVRLHALSRALPWPLQRWHSSRLFAWRLRRYLQHTPGVITHNGNRPLLVRHLKLAAWLVQAMPALRFAYEAHEVFGDTAAASKQATQRALEQTVLRGAAAIIANSGATAERLQSLYGAAQRIEVIPNGVSWPVTLPDKPWAEAAQHIVYAGSFFPWKGVNELMAAAAQLPGHRLQLIGEENINKINNLRNISGSAGATLDFTGRLTQGEVMTQLGASCIAVLPNRDDTDSRFTSPIKLFEYMAAGCAIVASDLPALREILGAEDAVWVRAGDAQSLAEGIRGLAANPDLARAMGERVRQRARGYTWQARATRVLEVLQHLG
jgi:glycosyltransferase involved in cell wall biosynthesis